MTTTVIAGTDDGRVCLLGLRIFGTGPDIACIGKAKSKGAEPAPKTTYCRLMPPISWSKNDTQETKDEIRAYNASRDSLCGSAPWKRK